MRSVYGLVAKLLIAAALLGVGPDANRSASAGPLGTAIKVDVLALGAVAAFITATAMAGPQAPQYQRNIEMLATSLRIHVIAGAPIMLRALRLLVLRDPSMLTNAQRVAADLGLDGQSLGHAAAGAASTAPATTQVVNGITYQRQTTRAGDVFFHYSFLVHASHFAGGLRPLSYATDIGTLSGIEAQEGLALPHANPPDAVYTVTPAPGTPVLVDPTHPTARPMFNQPGGLPEYIFPEGTTPGSISPPRAIPP